MCTHLRTVCYVYRYPASSLSLIIDFLIGSLCTKYAYHLNHSLFNILLSKPKISVGFGLIFFFFVILLSVLIALVSCVFLIQHSVYVFFSILFFFFSEIAPSMDCYYNYNHYSEGDRILTNEPCLNCTCHNRMLMCYLKVCPFTKPIGQDCKIEKREDQCCPVITCPEGK